MRLSVHLFDESVLSFDEILRQFDENDGRPTWLNPSVILDFSCRLASAVDNAPVPTYAHYLDDYFSVEWALGVTRSAVLGVLVEGRYFALTFGQGRHLLRRERLVHDFGIRVTANSLDEDKLRGLRYQRMSETGRRTQQSVAIPSQISEFGVELGSEWVQSLAGDTEDDIARGMSGAQALQIDLPTTARDLKQLPRILAELLKRYVDRGYRDRFPFLDLLVPLPAHGDLAVSLDRELLRMLREGSGRELDRIGVLEPADAVEAVGFRAVGDRTRVGPYRIDLLKVQHLVWRRCSIDHVVLGVSADGARVGRWQLREFLTAEVSQDGCCFVLISGRWFEVDPDYLADIHRKIDQIVTEDGALGLPPWPIDHDEPGYNLHAVKKEKGRFRLLDKDLYQVLGPRTRVEICDLLDERLNLICVKRLRGSAGLSHLFAQGSVSAELYRSLSGYREKVAAEFRDSWKDVAPPAKATIVYAVGTKRSGPIRDVLPFFSKVHLVWHIRRIRESHLDVALIKIPMVYFGDSPAPPPRGPTDTEIDSPTLF